MPLLLLFPLVACRDGDDAPPEPTIEHVACDVAGDEGLAVRIARPHAPRYGDVAPVVVRVSGIGADGFTDDFADGPAQALGVAVVRFLDPGATDGDVASGGTFDGYGDNRLAAIGCAVGRAAELGDPVLLTGLSIGGNAVLLADVAVDGVVLWESPLTDQLVLIEPSPGDVVDPTFTPGSCTLDAGCPFPDRADDIRLAAGEPWRDFDDDGVIDADEPAYHLLPDGSGATFPSVALDADLRAGGRSLPDDWPDADALAAFWSPRDAAPALRAVRDGARDGRFLYVATADDHAQVFHEHVRLAQEGLGAASFFRLGPDAAYMDALGAPVDVEHDAGTLVADVYADGALPTASSPDLVLAAELELADRARDGDWRADLDAVLYSP